jgi:ADP-ribose pyrophosphatase YjhB (NUDIX family)
LTVSPAIEVVPLRKTENGVEVLLTERSTHDPIWSSKLHTPGTILRPTDDNLSEGFNRIFNDELGVDVQTINFVGVSFGHGIRGPGVGLEYWTELNTDPKIGKFYNIDNLPENYIMKQKGLLDSAVDSFRNHVA